jgi:phytoene desaturase
MNKKVVIIGSGFASLSAACYLSKAGCDVTVYEKNEQPGGRASRYTRDGFVFDMGPSWYWMPDIFEKFFADFGKSVSDYYQLDRLDPAYQIFFKDDILTIGGSLTQIEAEFERIEPGSSKPLRAFMLQAQDNYRIAIDKMVYKPGLSPLELVSSDTVTRLGRFFSTISKDIRRVFKNPKLVALLEFPVLFLGAKPSDTPSFYSFMNYADFGLGTWHPKGGMYAIVEAMVHLATSLGVKFETNTPVSSILVENKKALGIQIGDKKLISDVVLSGADYQHTETLLPPALRQYSEKYWNSRTFAPSSLLFYVGFNKKIPGVRHHNLFFDTDFEQHAREIYDAPKWPKAPLFYANFPSITDPTMAPKDCENGFFLMPLAPGLEDTDELRLLYFDTMLNRLEAHIDEELRSAILFKESFCVNDFVNRYNSYKGNAYGMANTLLQTAFLRPNLRSNKVNSLYFTGQLTVPGPGVPPAIISGKLVSELILNKRFQP